VPCPLVVSVDRNRSTNHDHKPLKKILQELIPTYLPIFWEFSKLIFIVVFQ